MKIFTTVLILFALVLIVFNITLLDFYNIFEGDSLVGLIGIMASICAVLILVIFRLSKLIQDKTRN